MISNLCSTLVSSNWENKCVRSILSSYITLSCRKCKVNICRLTSRICCKFIDNNAILIYQLSFDNRSLCISCDLKWRNSYISYSAVGYNDLFCNTIKCYYISSAICKACKCSDCNLCCICCINTYRLNSNNIVVSFVCDLDVRSLQIRCLTLDCSLKSVVLCLLYILKNVCLDINVNGLSCAIVRLDCDSSLASFKSLYSSLSIYSCNSLIAGSICKLCSRWANLCSELCLRSYNYISRSCEADSCIYNLCGSGKCLLNSLSRLLSSYLNRIYEGSCFLGMLYLCGFSHYTSGKKYG